MIECESRKQSIQGFVFIVFLCSSANVAAQDGYWTRGVPGESDKFKIALADNGRPLWYVLKQDSTLRQLVKEKCGGQSDKVLNYLLHKASELNAVNDVDSEIDAGDAVAIPYCHRIDRNVQVSVKAGDTIDRILQYRVGLHGPKSVRAVVNANSTESEDSVTPEIVSRFSIQLKPDSMLTLPYVSQRRLFIPAGDNNFPPYKLLEKYPPTDFSHDDVATTYRYTDDFESAANEAVDETLEFASSSVGEVSEPNVDDDALQGGQDTALQFDDIVTFESGGGPADCAEDVGSEHFDADLFFQRVLSEKKVLESAGRTTNRSIVGIIDSGLRTVGQGIFEERYFEANITEQQVGSVRGADDDDNDFIDDIWGIDFVENSGEIRPFPASSPKRTAHGSQVASLVLGGLDYLDITRQEQPLIKLIIVNFGDRLRDIQPPEKLFSAVDYLVERSADIVNMSLSSKVKLRGLKERVDRQENKVLFVVAAGNTIPRGRRLQLFPRYPASWGGAPDRPNLISVAAVDSANNKASFSNYGKEVDLYAPGCSLRTKDHENNVVIDFGTSMATAHVSFVSSVMRALGGAQMSPTKIKNRLIASADYAPSFPNPWLSSQILNEIKAISLTHDVVEITSNSQNASELRLGRFADIEELRQYCGGPQRRDLDKVHKITPNIEINGTTWIRYLASPSSNLGEVMCEQVNEGMKLPGYSEGGVAIPDISITEVSDIVIAAIRL